jgi:ABC-type nitrate/sulfonate/bicarbonate transport system substrate-binding protein
VEIVRVEKMDSRTPVTVALDWTPNTNHSGFYVALADGLYDDANLQVRLKSADESGAQGLTPARQVAAGEVNFAVGPSESAVSFATTDKSKPRLVAVAALVQGSTSAICTLAGSGIDRPSQLAGKRYASYAGRFEDAIVARMVSNDGGDGAAVACHPLDFHAYVDEKTMGAGSVVASYLQTGSSDSTWIFAHWEGVLAERAGQRLNYFALEDYGVPYGYSPILLARPDQLEGAAATTTRAFLAATAEGYRRAAADPDAAAKALCACGHPSLSDDAFVRASSHAIAPKYLSSDGASWGHMTLERWTAFVDFLSDSSILTDREGVIVARESIEVAKLFTNDFLA